MFDVEELITVLKNDNAVDIVTIAVPPEFRYVDYMVVASGRSFKHLYAMAEYVRKLFKLKRSESDIIPKIEGYELAKSTNTQPTGWLALDLGTCDALSVRILLEDFFKHVLFIYRKHSTAFVSRPCSAEI